MKAIPPANARIQQLIPGSYFHDAWSVQAGDPGLSALGQFLKAIAATPTWVNHSMALRNHVVEKLGLKNLGGLGAFDPDKTEDTYQPGDRVGIFTLFEQTFDEVLLGDKDKHLDVTLSVHRQAFASGSVQVTVTTVVHVNNALGRLYMLPVAPMHRLIAPTVLRAVART
ncbi:MAG: DUF2867 domain-containing protein [Limnohabitans sp.]|jgi:hypothetical protein